MSTYISNNDITAVVLAGGRGERMGGQDKGLVELWGQPLLAHVINAIDGKVAGLIISANRNLEQYRTFAEAVISDHSDEFLGPLAGVATALREASTSYLLTLPCDTPCLPSDLVDRMRAALESTDAELCVVHDGARLQNTIALLPCSFADDLDAYLQSGQRKVEVWLRQHKMAEVDFSESAERFVNINSETQLKQLQAQKDCR